MPINLDYAQTRALAKKFRHLTGKDISHTDVLSEISSVVGMPMDGMMHKLKSEAKADSPKTCNPWDKSWKPGGPTVATFDAIDRHPSIEIPDFEAARPVFELMISKAPRKTHYAFVLLQIDNLDELLPHEAEGVFSRLAAGIRAYVIEHHTIAACTRRGEVAILLDDVDAMDEDDATLGWFSRSLPFKRHDDQPEVLVTAVVTEMELNDPNEDPLLTDVIEESRNAITSYNEMRSSFRFIWGPSGF